METTLAKVRAALHRAAVTGYGHMPADLERELMNQHHIIECRPGAWKVAAVQAVIYAAGFFAMGYFAKPIIDRLMGG